jgi:ankyrin repeat protein
MVIMSGIQKNKEIQNKLALGTASVNGKKHVVELLLSMGMNPNITFNDGITPLMLASLGNHTETVRLLLEKGSNPNIKYKYRLTALNYAKRKGNQELIQLLKEYGSR